MQDDLGQSAERVSARGRVVSSAYDNKGQQRLLLQPMKSCLIALTMPSEIHTHALEEAAPASHCDHDRSLLRQVRRQCCVGGAQEGRLQLSNPPASRRPLLCVPWPRSETTQ